VLTDILPALDDLSVILVDLSLSAFSRLSRVAKWLVTVATLALSCCWKYSWYS